MWGWGEAQTNQNISTELEERLKDQTQLITQLKEVIRENEVKLQEKDKQIEETNAKFSKFKLQTKAKVNQLTNQLSEAQKKQSDSISPFKKDDDDDASSESSHGSHATDQSNRAKLILLKKQLDDSKALNEKQENQIKELNSVVQKLEEQLSDNEAAIDELKRNVARLDYEGTNGADANEMYTQIVYKDNKILELNNRILQLEGNVMDLQENVKEKDEVIGARNKAIQLLTEDLSLRKKNVVDQLDDTRDEMRQMQFNFTSLETSWNEEKETLLKELSSKEEKFKLEITEKNNKLVEYQESLKMLESVRFELSTRNATLQEKVVKLQEHLEKAKKNMSNGGVEELTKQILVLKEQLTEKETIISSLQMAGKETMAKQKSGENKSVVKIKAQYVSRIKSLEKQLESAQRTAEELPDLNRRIIELNTENNELKQQLENQTKSMTSKEEDLHKAADKQAKVKELLDNFCKTHGVIAPTHEAIEEGFSQISITKKRLEDFIDSLYVRFSVSSLEELDSGLNELLEREKNLKSEVENYKAEVNEIKEKLDKVEKDLESLKITSKEEKNLLNERIQTQEQEFENIKTENENKIAKLEFELSDRESKIKEINGIMENKISLISGDRERELMEFQKRLADAAKAEKERIEMYTLEKSDWDSKMEELNKKMMQSQNCISDFELDLSEKEKIISAFQIKIEDLTKEKEEADNKVQLMIEKLTNMEKTISNSESDLSEKEREIHELQKRIELYAREQENSVERTRSQIDSYHKELEEKNSLIQQLELALKSKLESNDEINIQLQEHISRLDDSLKKEKTQSQEFKLNLEKSEEKFNEAQTKLEKNSNILKDQEEQIAILEEKLKEEGLKALELKKEQDETLNQFETYKCLMERDLKSKTVEIEEMVSNQSKIVEEIRLKETFIEEMQRITMQLQSENVEKETIIANLQRQYTVLQNEISAEREEKEIIMRDMQQKCVQLKSEIDADNAEKEGMIANLQAKCIQLQNDLSAERTEKEVIINTLQEKYLLHEQEISLENAKKEALITSLQEELAYLQNQVLVIDTMESSLEEKNAELETVKVECDAVISDLKEKCIQQQNQMETEILRLQQQYAQLQEEITTERTEKEAIIMNMQQKCIELQKEFDNENTGKEVVMNLRETCSLLEKELNIEREEKRRIDEKYLSVTKNFETFQRNSTGELSSYHDETRRLSVLLTSKEQLEANLTKLLQEKYDKEEKFQLEFEKLQTHMMEEKEKLQNDNNSLAEKNSKLTSYIVQLEEDLSSLDGTCEKTNNEKQLVEEKLNEKSATIKVLEKKITDLEINVEKLETAQIEHENAFAVQKSEAHKLNEKLKDNEEFIFNLTNQKEEVNKICQAISIERDSLIEKVKTDGLTIDQLTKEKETTEKYCQDKELMIDQLNKTSLKNETRVNELMEEIEKLNIEKENALSSTKTAEQSFDTAYQELKVKFELEKKESEDKRNKLEEVWNQLKSLQAENEKLQNSLTEEAENQIKSEQNLKDEIQICTDKISELTNSKEEVELRLSAAIEKSSELEEMYEAIVNELKVTVDKFAELQKDFENKKENEKNITSTLEEVYQKHKDNESIIASNKTEIETLETKLRVLDSELKNSISMGEELQFKLQECITRNQQLQEQSDETANKVEDITREKNDLINKLENLNKIHETYKNEKEDLIKRIQETNKELQLMIGGNEDKWLKEIEELNCEIKSLNEKLTEKGEKIEQYEAEVLTVSEDKFRVEEELKKVVDENKRLIEHTEKSMKDIQHVLERNNEEKLTTLLQMNDHLKMRERAEEICENLKHQNEKLLDYLNTKETEITKLQTVEDEITLLKKNREEMENVVSQKNERLDELTVLNLEMEAKIIQLQSLVERNNKKNEEILKVESEQKINPDSSDREKDILSNMKTLQSEWSWEEETTKPCLLIGEAENNEVLKEENLQLKSEIDDLKKQLRDIISENETMTKKFFQDFEKSGDKVKREDLIDSVKLLEANWAQDSLPTERVRIDETETKAVIQENKKMQSELEALKIQMCQLLSQIDVMTKRFVRDLETPYEKRKSLFPIANNQQTNEKSEDSFAETVKVLESGWDQDDWPIESAVIFEEDKNEAVFEENLKLKNEVEEVKTQVRNLISQIEVMTKKYVQDLEYPVVVKLFNNLSTNNTYGSDKEKNITESVEMLEANWANDGWEIEKKILVEEPTKETLIEENAKLKYEIEELKLQVKELITKFEKMSKRYITDLGTGDETNNLAESVKILTSDWDQDEWHTEGKLVLKNDKEDDLLEENMKLKDEIEKLQLQVSQLISQLEVMSKRVYQDLETSKEKEELCGVLKTLESDWTQEGWHVEKGVTLDEESNESVLEENIKLKIEIDELKSKMSELISQVELTKKRTFQDLEDEHAEKKGCRETELNESVKILESSWLQEHQTKSNITIEDRTEDLVKENVKLKDEVEDLKLKVANLITQLEITQKKLYKDLEVNENLSDSGKILESDWQLENAVKLKTDLNQAMIEENMILKTEIEDLKSQLETRKIDLGVQTDITMLCEEQQHLLHDLTDCQLQLDAQKENTAVMTKDADLLQEKFNKLSDEKNKLVNDLSGVKRENEEIVSHFDELNKLYQEQKDEILRLKTNAKHPIVETDKLVSSVPCPESEELNSLKVKNGKLLVKLKQFKEKSDKLQQEIKTLKEGKESLEKSIKEAEAEKKSLKQQLTSLNEKLDMLEVSNSNLVEMKDDLENKLEWQMERSKELMEQKTILGNEMKKIKEENESWEREIQSNKEQAETLISDNNTFQIVVENLKQAKIRTEEELRQHLTQIYHLTEEKGKLIQTIDKLKDVEIKYQELLENSKGNDSLCKELKEKLKSSMDQLQHFQMENDALRKDKIELELKFAQISDHEKMKIDETLTSLQREKIELENEVEELKREFREANIERSEMSKRLSSAEELVSEKEGEITKMKSETFGAHTNVTELKLMVNQLQKELQEFRIANDESKSLADTTMQRNMDLIQEIESISTKKSDLLEKLTVLSKDFEVVQREKLELARELDEKKKFDTLIENKGSHEERDELRNELEHTIHILHEREYQCRHLTEEIAQVIDEKNNLQMQLSGLARNSHQQERRIDELTQRLEEEREISTQDHPSSSDLILNIEENKPLIIPATNYTLTRTMRGTAWRMKNWLLGRSMRGKPILHV